MDKLRSFGGLGLAAIMVLAVAGTAMAAPPLTDIKEGRFTVAFVDDEICAALGA